MGATEHPHFHPNSDYDPSVSADRIYRLLPVSRKFRTQERDLTDLTMRQFVFVWPVCISVGWALHETSLPVVDSFVFAPFCVAHVSFFFLLVEPLYRHNLEPMSMIVHLITQSHEHDAYYRISNISSANSSRSRSNVLW